MAATPKGGSMILRAGNGTSRSVDLYRSDVANAFTNIESAGAAGTASDTRYIVQATGIISDISLITGTADTNKLQLIVNGVPRGDIFDYVIHVSTSNSRPALAISVRQGDEIKLKQLA